jgi:LPS export ABC transporter permease LptG
MLACGISPYRVLRPVLALAAAATAATAWVMFEAVPNANQTFREITFDIISKKIETDVRPRVFFEDFPGWTLFARDEPDPGQPGWKELLVADTTKDGPPTVFVAKKGRLVLDRQKRTVDLVLQDGIRYATPAPGEIETLRFPADLILSLNPDAVFPSINIQPGPNEKTIGELRATTAEKLKNKLSPHPEIIALQQKYSIPVACLVFAIIGVALGLSVAREGKMAGFVVGIAVIFAYYIVMLVAQAQTRGHYVGLERVGALDTANWLNAHLSRWWPNIILGVFGIVALVWRARYADGRLPSWLPIAFIRVPMRRGRIAETATGEKPARLAGPANRRTVVVIRLPRVRMPVPRLIDRYITRTYLRIVGLCFLGLVGLFYISTFIDRSDKIFRGQTDTSTVATLLVWLTPQFVYYVIPLTALLSVLVTYGMLSRTSELTVMKACGISLYRASAAVILLAFVFSGAIFLLEQQILARANRRAEIIDARIKGTTPRVFDALNRRWIAGREGSIYHYRLFDPERQVLSRLTIYTPRENDWVLQKTQYADRAVFEGEGWVATSGWEVDYATKKPTWRAVPQQVLADLEPPRYFETEQPLPEMMTVAQLRTFVNELSASGMNVVPLAVELQRKLAFPFVTLVMTLLAIPFGVSTGKRGALYAIGLGIVIALSYWILSSVFIAIGKGGLLAPWLAAWAPNIIFLGGASYLFLTVRT